MNKNQRKIYKKQAENWMMVCHYAMELFPEMWMPDGVLVDPKHSSAIIMQLLAERRGMMSQGSYSVSIQRVSTDPLNADIIGERED